MGEMADMALQYAAETEEQAYSYLSGEMSLNEAYDNGLIGEGGYATQDMSHIADRHWEDLTDTDNQLKHTVAEFDRACVEKGTDPLFGGGQFVRGKREKTISESKLKTYKFLLGFARHYLKNSHLSPKQIAIIETNWDGGAEKFCHDVDRNNLTDTLEKVINKFS